MSVKSIVKANAAVALVDSSGGTASGTIPAQTGSYVEATQETTIATLAAQIEALRQRMILQGL